MQWHGRDRKCVFRGMAEVVNDPRSDPAPVTAAPHPEEMRASVDWQVGKLMSLRATARATPAGLAATALLLAAVLVPVMLLRRRR
jgi:hypothetical protein